LIDAVNVVAPRLKADFKSIEATISGTQDPAIQLTGPLGRLGYELMRDPGHLIETLSGQEILRNGANDGGNNGSGSGSRRGGRSRTSHTGGGLFEVIRIHEDEHSDSQDDTSSPDKQQGTPKNKATPREVQKTKSTLTEDQENQASEA
jgi:hypothetical protein